MKIKAVIGSVAVASMLFAGCSMINDKTSVKQANGSEKVAQVIEFPSSKYPETGAHIKEAIEKGKTDICTRGSTTSLSS